MNRAHSESSSHTSVNTKRPGSGTIESSVTRLLVSTKHLLESLTQWTRQEVDDKYVSDAYVKLGNDFRAAIRAFSNARVDVSDIGDVPKALRIVLESALSEPPTQESLDRFLPNIRSIIVNLLQNLKQKQLKAKGLEDGFTQESHLIENELARHSSSYGTAQTPRQESKNTETQNDEHSLLEQTFDTKDTKNTKDGKTRAEGIGKDALQQLQESRAILRRASKRFSAYQFAKLTNASKPNLPTLKPDQPGLSFESPTKAVNDPKVKEEPTCQITTYLLIGGKTKKVSLDKPVTMASLRLCFVEKFAYSPGSTIFPDIYVESMVNGRSYELEEHMLDAEVVEGVSLLLKDPFENESLDSKFDKFTNGVNSSLESLKDELRNLSSEMMKAYQSSQVMKPLAGTSLTSETSKLMKELESISREFKAMKQVQNSQRTELESILHLSIDSVAKLKESALTLPLGSNRDYMDNSYAKLSKDSDTLLTRVDDLLDMMEALRKDVAQRGVRVGDKQIKNASSEIEAAKSSLYALRQYIVGERPAWKKIWEQELDKVCEEQQFLTLQDDLTLDLEEDIRKIEETFDLIMRCSTQQSRIFLTKRTEIASRINLLDSKESLHGLKDAMLTEVASLVPNHSDRIEAIARAERMRVKEQQMLGPDQFQEELDTFVNESRLKKSGGIEELEKNRREKDNENLRSFFGVI